MRCLWNTLCDINNDDAQNSDNSRVCHTSSLAILHTTLHETQNSHSQTGVSTSMTIVEVEEVVMMMMIIIIINIIFCTLSSKDPED